MFHDRVCNSVLVLWLWAKRQQQKHFSATCGVTLCPAAALLPKNSVIYYSIFAMDERSKNNAEKVLSLWTAVPHFDILIFPEDTIVRWTEGIRSWEICDLFLDLFPAFTCTCSMFVLQGCRTNCRRTDQHRDCVSSPIVLRLTAAAAPSVPCLLTRSQPNTKWLTKAIHLCPNENF